MILETYKKEMILETIEVRLDNIKDVTKRSRLAFLVITIASCAILITMWNAYFSTVREIIMLQNQEIKQSNDSLRIALPMEEHNRRALASEWVDNINVSINLLGIDINVNDFPFVGSFSLFVISFWFFFTSRRENRAIVSFLRDIKNDLEFSAEKQQKGNERWDIANLAFHGVSNSLLFFTTGTNDKPLSDNDIFQVKSSLFVRVTDNFIGWLTKLIRALVAILVFIPAITIGIVIGVDQYSTYNIRSLFRKNFDTPAAGMSEDGENSSGYIKQIVLENKAGTVFGVITFLICAGCLIFQFRTTAALKSFEEALDGNRPWSFPPSISITDGSNKDDPVNY